MGIQHKDCHLFPQGVCNIFVGKADPHPNCILNVSKQSNLKEHHVIYYVILFWWACCYSQREVWFSWNRTPLRWVLAVEEVKISLWEESSHFAETPNWLEGEIINCRNDSLLLVSDWMAFLAFILGCYCWCYFSLLLQVTLQNMILG